MGQRERFAYDAVGNRICHVDFNGATTEYRYDLSDREIERTYLDEGTTVTTTYTASGQVDTVTDAQGTTDRDVDERDRLTRIAYPTGQVIEYGYDARGLKLTLRSGNHEVRYSYSVLGQLSGVSDTNGTTTYVYDALGRQREVRYPNGTVTTTTYDSRSRPTLVETTNANGDPLARTAYTLDAAGHRTRLTELERTVDYTYDALYRLTGETVTDSSGTRTTTWTYDAVGNRLSQVKGGLTTTYAYDPNDRLLSGSRSDGTGTTYTYDANGNTVEKNEDGQVTAYIWNADNRLVAASTPDAELAFTYDTDGIRQSRTVNGTRTDFLVDPNRDYQQVIAETVNGAEQTWYTYGTDLLAQERAGDLSYYHYDALGSTRALSDASGSLTDSYAYRAFGEGDTTEGTTPNAYLFTGEQFEPVLQQYYLRARYMDPRVGRFVGIDPFDGYAQYPATLHKFVYAGNVPTSYTDPGGESFLAGQIIGINASFALGNSVRTASGLAARHAFNKLMFGRPPGDWGIIGNHIMGHMLRAVEGVLGEPFANKGAFGTAAHKRLETRIGSYEPLPGVKVEAEAYIRKGGELADQRREKGSLGIDVLVTYKGKPALLVDLKTGRGFPGKKRREIQTRYLKMAGRDVPLVQVFIKVR